MAGVYVWQVSLGTCNITPSNLGTARQDHVISPSNEMWVDVMGITSVPRPLRSWVFILLPLGSPWRPHILEDTAMSSQGSLCKYPWLSLCVQRPSFCWIRPSPPPGTEINLYMCHTAEFPGLICYCSLVQSFLTNSSFLIYFVHLQYYWSPSHSPRVGVEISTTFQGEDLAVSIYEKP